MDMSSTFKEYLIKQNKSPKDVAAQVGIVAGAIVLTLILLSIGGSLIGPILIVGIIFGAAFLFSKFSREYEYILTNNELDIDVIYNRSKRKRVTTIDMKKIEIMASIEDASHKGDLEKGTKTINASDNSNGANTYAIIGQTQFGLTKVLITPNDEFLKELHRQAPNKVFKRI